MGRILIHEHMIPQAAILGYSLVKTHEMSKKANNLGSLHKASLQGPLYMDMY